MPQPEVSSAPSISGRSSVGSKLYVSTGVWTSEEEVSIQYQWYRCLEPVSAGKSLPQFVNCQLIRGETLGEYMVTEEDFGKHLTAKVSASNGSTPVDYFATSASIQDRTAIKRVSNPKLKGKKSVGSVLRSSKGTWSASSSAAISYSWVRCDAKVTATELKLLSECKKIKGAKTASYRLKPADKGSYVTVRVRAKVGKETSYFTPKALKKVKASN
jgi:hypothetical protein